MFKTSDLIDMPHGFFGRLGGVSQGIYTSLNCGYGSDDDNDYVHENRQIVANEFNIASNHLLTLHQIHSADVVVVDAPWKQGEGPRADAMVTTHKNIALGILTADCAPILFADHQNGVIAAAHAGWKGALGNIMENTITTMVACGAKRQSITAMIGPSIQQASYEVGPDFPAPFLADDAANAQFFISSQTPRHFMFDLSGYILHRLHQSGIQAADRFTIDTYNNDNHFFSYRRTCHRNESDYGRHISTIMLE